MRAFTDYEQTREYSNFKRLPAGAYEVKIIRAEDSEKALCLLFDISGGEFDSYYHKRFDYDREHLDPGKAKYKGVFRLWYSDGGQYDENKKSRMKTALKTIKDNNRLNIDFTREWDGAALKGSRVGMIFRDQEWEYNGKTGIAAQPFAVISLDKLKSGDYEIPKTKYLKKTAQADLAESNPNGFAKIPLDDDLPF